MGYKVKLQAFEGPFDLLVYLIENARMNIYDIRVSEITAQYLDYIEQMQQMDVTVSSEFMVLAAELIELKSRMLLPRSNPETGEVVAEDPRTELVARILEYKTFKTLSGYLAEREEHGFMVREKPQEDISQYRRMSTSPWRWISSSRRSTLSCCAKSVCRRSAPAMNGSSGRR